MKPDHFSFLPASRFPAATAVLAATLLSTTCLSAAHWPGWRGPEGTGITVETNLPVRWSRTENIRWRTPLPGPGNSTPVVWGDRVFVTQALDGGTRRALLCFDRADGRLLWQREVTYLEEEVTHATNPHCSASPATDGERVIVSFASAGLFCYDFEGNELWRRDLGKQAHIWGNGASPVLYRDWCFLNFGPGERTFLMALDKKSGETVWRVDEPGGHFGEAGPGQAQASVWIGSWSDPIVRTVRGREELIMSFPGRVCAFDPATGKEFWTCGGLNPLVYTSPLYHDGVVVAMGGFNGMALAVRAGGSGDVTETHRLWHHPRTRQRIGSGAIAGDHIYIVNDPGIAECIELQTGRVVWEERLRGPSPTAQSWASMVVSGDKLYVVNQGGDAFVLRASPTFELISTNSLGEKTIASMAVSDGEIFLRTYENLWCVSER